MRNALAVVRANLVEGEDPGGETGVTSSEIRAFLLTLASKVVLGGVDGAGVSIRVWRFWCRVVVSLESAL